MIKCLQAFEVDWHDLGDAEVEEESRGCWDPYRGKPHTASGPSRAANANIDIANSSHATTYYIQSPQEVMVLGTRLKV